MRELTKKLTELNANTRAPISMVHLERARSLITNLLKTEDWQQIHEYCDKHQKRKLTENDFACFIAVLVDCLEKQNGEAPYARFTAWSRTEQASKLGISEWCNCHLTPMFLTMEATGGITIVHEEKRGKCRQYEATDKFTKWLQKLS